MNYELPLVLFTSFTQLGVGLALFTAFRQCAQAEAAVSMHGQWLAVWLLTSVGLLFSLLHLGSPTMAATALKNLSFAWLSREGLIFYIFVGLALLCVWRSQSKGLAIATALAGIAGLIAQGMTYAVPAMPAINNAWPMVWFFMAAILSGAALSLAFGDKATLARVLAFCSIVSVALLLAAPLLWSGSDDSIIRETAALWFASPFYMAALGCFIVVARVFDSPV